MLYSNLNSQDICDSLELFENMDLFLGSNELTVLTGPNGAGKSTLLRLLNVRALEAGYSVIYAPQSPPGSALSEGQKQMLRWLEWMELGFHSESILLLDEPFRHLDTDFRRKALSFLRSVPGYRLIVSHDMDLLQGANRIYHLQNGFLESYGGNLDFYRMERQRQRQARRRQSEALRNRLHENRKKSKEINQRQSHRTKKAVADNETQNIPRSFINKQKNRAEKTAARLNGATERKSRILERQQKEAYEKLKTLESEPGGIVRIPCGPGKKHALVVENLGLDFGATRARENQEEASSFSTVAIPDLNLQVERGEVVWLQGKNGAGKSTTLKSVSNLLRSERGEVTKGTISYNGESIKDLDPADMVRSGVIQVMEGRHCFEHLTVEENLLTGAYTRRVSGSEIQESLDLVYNYFPRLKERRKSLAGYTSGGEQQMVAIGRALMSQPETILLDEPSMGLAPQLVEEIFEIVKQLNEKESVAFLLAEQNTNVALKYAHKGYILESGRVVMDGPAKELRENPDVKEFYLGMSEEGRSSFKNTKSYRRRKRWL